MITLNAKNKIYKLLLASLPLGTHHMNNIAQCLTDHGITCRKHGYKKMIDMLRDMPEFIQIVHAGGANQAPQIRLKKWATNEPKVQAARLKKRAGANIGTADGTKPPFKQKNQKGNLLPKYLLPVSHLEEKPLELLTKKIGKSSPAIPPLIEAAYQQARATHRIDIQKDSIRFSMDFNMAYPRALILTFKRVPTDEEGRYLSFQYVEDTNMLLSNGLNINVANPARTLEQFAFLGNWDDFLEELADLAIDEEWDFCGTTPKNHYILKKYIQYTFYRVYIESKISVSEDRRLAAFNTGLVNDRYDDIYACFVPNNAGSSPWLFKEFAIAGQRGMGKQLVHLFNPLPEPAAYFEAKEELIFDMNKKLHCDYNHIVRENIDRFPIEFLDAQCYDRPDARRILQKIKHAKDPAQKELLYTRLEDYLSEDITLYNRLKNRLDDATTLARKQIKWNYRTAVPSYYPARNTVNLMLPLHLSSYATVDNVLVVEATQSGNYQGQTILTMEQAYIDARLIASPQTSWLTTSSVINCPMKDSE